MNGLYSCIIAFSMYSKIPMPKIDWSQVRMKYVMCFFPLIGGVIGLLLLGWGKLASLLLLSPMGYAVFGTILPLLITGGIHMDGFLDTIDAISSYEMKERKLEILKDPHAGAFAIIGCGMYLLLYTGVLYEMPLDLLPVFCCSFVLTRALSGLSVVTFPSAKSSGFVSAFAASADQIRNSRVLVLYSLLVSGFMIYLDVRTGIFAVAAALLIFFYYYKMANKQFGGITGDLAGYFLQLCELGVLLVIMVTGRL